MKELVEELINYINDGKIVSFPTETVYALACDAENINSINKIYNIKNRDKSKLFSVFIDIDSIEKYIYLNNKDLAYDFLLEGTTVIFKKKEHVLPFINSDTLGIRYPKHDFTRLLLKKLKNPIVATSVNLSGQPPLCDYESIIKNFTNIDFVIDNSLLLNNYMTKKPSKIVSLTSDEIVILRE